MIRSARINQGSQVAQLGDVVQWYNAAGGRETGRIHRFRRAGGNTVLVLDDGREVDAWYAQLAQLIRITPHSNHVLAADLVAGDRVIQAGTTILVTTWYAGTVAIVVNNELPGLAIPVPNLIAALLPGRDPRLATFSLGGGSA